MHGNATATIIGNTTDFYKVLGTTTPSDINQKFTHTDGRLTYTGSLTKTFNIDCIISLSSSNNNIIKVRIAKSGTTSERSEQTTTTSGAGRSDNLTIKCLGEFSTGDFLEVFVRNTTGSNNITASDLYLSISVL